MQMYAVQMTRSLHGTKWVDNSGYIQPCVANLNALHISTCNPVEAYKKMICLYNFVQKTNTLWIILVISPAQFVSKNCMYFHGAVYALLVCILWRLYEVRTGGRESDSLVVKHHVRQPDVFGGQPDLHHSIKLLRDPSQTIVLPLLKANKNTTLSHSSANHTAGNDILREEGVSVCLFVFVTQSLVNMTCCNKDKPEVRSVLSAQPAPSSHFYH